MLLYVAGLLRISIMKSFSLGKTSKHVGPLKRSVTVEKARSLLGHAGRDLSDEQMQRMLDFFYAVRVESLRRVLE